MLDEFLTIVDKFAKDNNLVLVGVMLLVAVFVLSFFYKTFWGQWKDRTKEDAIYGKKTNHKSHLLRDKTKTIRRKK